MTLLWALQSNTSPMASICLMLVSTAWVREGRELSFTTGREMVSALLNIFISLRLFVDQSKITPSREPDAKKLPTWMEEHGHSCMPVWCVGVHVSKEGYPLEISRCKYQSNVCVKFRKGIANCPVFTTLRTGAYSTYQIHSLDTLERQHMMSLWVL